MNNSIMKPSTIAIAAAAGIVLFACAGFILFVVFAASFLAAACRYNH